MPLWLWRYVHSYMTVYHFDSLCLAAQGIFGIAAIVILIAILCSLVQASGHRTPMVALLFAVLCFTGSMILRVLMALISRTSNIDVATFYLFQGMHTALNGVACMLVIAAAMLVLWNRRTAASSRSELNPTASHTPGLIVKRVWDSLILFALGAMAVSQGVTITHMANDVDQPIYRDNTYAQLLQHFSV